MHLGGLVGDRGDRREPDDGVAVAVRLLDAQAGQLVGNLGLDVVAEQLVDQVLRGNGWRTMRQPSSIGSNCFSFGRSVVACFLNHHEVCTKGAWVGSISWNAA